MAHSYHEIAFTPTILDLQSQDGSRDNYAAMSEGSRYANRLTEREGAFIGERDSFYMASVSETGWPYVQHRGGPKGFMKVLDEKTIGFADYSGNRQYVSTGNFRKDDRVSLFFMDYPNRRRLKMLGRVRIVESHETDILEQLEDPDYAVQIERAFLITVDGFDWNCPAHITPRFTEEEVRAGVEELMAENRRLKHALENAAANDAGTESDVVLGEGPLELVISGVRQLTPRVRAYELRDPDGKDLPPVTAGAHLQVPVRLASGELTERHYSIASNPARPDAYEIAVLREEEGRGGSRAVHDSFAIGTVLRTGRPENHFPLHEDDTPAVLIAGGIGITAIKPMAQALEARGTAFEMHYAGQSRRDMAFRDRLERQLQERLSIYAKEDDERVDLEAALRDAPANALVYICGPDRLVAGVMAAARAVGFARDRIRLERFS
ncbi:MAG: pyridoxamine 5'-phosphate oxidase family protein [Halieaceae bacterium]|jgi:ferredoxin-NADP reductase/predicted pyridoxine 5'-phosphate oxidase superfamily flavin-nucleotide-binding protein|nr:pyridoxamine 5'-phosphate oxidase family protein [Halieaceae bacterium]